MTLAQQSPSTLLFGRYRVCSRCIYDERIAGIQFDDDGVCNYCRMVDDLTEMYGTGSPKGEEQFARIIDEIKRAGRNREFDCVIGVSGGTDSSYMVAKAVDWGLRPVAAHYDNTWNSAVATENIRKVLSPLKVPLFTHVVDNREVDECSTKVIRLPRRTKEILTPIPYIVPAQLFAACLATQKGLNPDQPRTLSKVTLTM